MDREKVLLPIVQEAFEKPMRCACKKMKVADVARGEIKCVSCFANDGLMFSCPTVCNVCGHEAVMGFRIYGRPAEEDKS